jgi:hypothetical protein
MGARQNASLDGDGANFVEGATIGPNALLRHLLPEELLDEMFIVRAKLLLRARIVCWKSGSEFVLDLLD